MLKYEISSINKTSQCIFYKHYLINFVFLLLIINFPIHEAYENKNDINNFVNVDEVKTISHNNAYKLVQLIVFYDAKEFTDDKDFAVRIYVHRVIKAAGELLYPLNIYLSITEYIKLKNTSTRISDITNFKNLYIIMNHKNLPTHNLAMIVSEYPSNTHAYRRGLCSGENQNLMVAKIHLKEFNDFYLIRDAEEIAYSIISMIGFTMDDEIIKDEFYNCTCLEDTKKCFTVYNSENCSLHRLLHRFDGVDCLRKAYKYFDGYSVDPICGNGIVEKGEVCDGGPQIYGASLLCTNTCQWTTFIIYSFFTVSIILLIFIVLLLFAVIYYRCKNSQKRKILKNLSTSSNFLCDPRKSSTSKFRYGNKNAKNNVGDNGTLSSNHTSNSEHSRTIIGLGKDNDIERELEELNEKEKSQLEDKSNNTLPLISKSTSDVALSPGVSSEPTAILLDNANTPNSLDNTMTSETLSGVFLPRPKNERLIHSTSNPFSKIKSRKNTPSPLVSHSMSVDLPSTVILTGNH